MLEYIFFHLTPRDRFLTFVAELGLPAETSEADDGLLVLLPEDVGEELDQRVEDFYDQLLDMTEELLAPDEPGAGQASGVTVTLEDGRTVYARVSPELLNRILTVVTPSELGELVNAVVDAVERPDERPLCRRD